MKKILLLCAITLGCMFNLAAQDRVDVAPKTLTYKSKELNYATYWELVKGKWKSRYNRKLDYKINGPCENFRTVFIGDLDSLKFLFVRYHTRVYYRVGFHEESYSPTKLYAGLISPMDYKMLKDIAPGQLIPVMSSYYNDIPSEEGFYFPDFLQQLEVEYKSHMGIYTCKLKTEGRDAADRYWNSQYLERLIFLVKRTTSSGKDVIRFRFFFNNSEALGVSDLNDLLRDAYFEVPYEEYMELFKPDRKLTYK